MIEHDFEALRKARNERVLTSIKKTAEKFGIPLEDVKSTFDPNACYCACGHGDPPYVCEHKWDGPEWVSADGCASSVTCSRCGQTAMSHSLRTLP